MTCCITYFTPPVVPNGRVKVFCKDSAMKTNQSIENQSLLPAERLAITTCLGKLLHAIGNMLQEQPDLRAGLSPESGQILVTIGEKLAKASGLRDA